MKRDLPSESELDRKSREANQQRNRLSNQRDKIAPPAPDTLKPSPESHWDTPETPGKKKLAPLLLLALLVIVALPVIFKFSITKEPDLKPRNPDSPTLLSFLENSTSAEIDNAIAEIIRGFMSSKSHEERCEFVEGGLGHLRQMTEFYSRPGVIPPTSFEEIVQIEPASFHGLPIYGVLATAEKGSPALLFQIVPVPGGVAIDWEVTVAYGEIPWAGFLSEKPTAPTQLRVSLSRAGPPQNFVQANDYYFSEMESRESPETIVACFQKNSPLAATLKKIIPQAAKQPVNLEARWNEELKSFEIVRLIHNFWMSDPAEPE